MPAAVVATAAQPSAAPAEVTPATSQPSATRHSPASSGGDAYARVQQPTCAAAVLASNTAPVPEPAGGGGMRTMRVADDMEVDDLDDLLEEFAGSNFGSRPTEPARQDWVAGGHFGSEGIDADELLGELDATLNDSSPALASSHSPSSSATTIRAHASLAPHVPSHRPQVSKKGNEVRGGGRERSAELQMWLGACWGLVEEWGHLTSKAGAEHTAMVYAGELPRSSHAKWLDEPARSELKELILSAFRYGVKLAYDSCLYGGGSSHDDMIESFTEYDKSWYFICKHVPPNGITIMMFGVQSVYMSLASTPCEQGEAAPYALRTSMCAQVSWARGLARLGGSCGIWRAQPHGNMAREGQQPRAGRLSR
jgi:hypothetical protein